MGNTDVWPIWQSNYKSMNSSQLMIEIKRIHQSPYFIIDHKERLAYLASELAIKERREF